MSLHLVEGQVSMGKSYLLYGPIFRSFRWSVIRLFLLWSPCDTEKWTQKDCMTQGPGLDDTFIALSSHSLSIGGEPYLGHCGTKMQSVSDEKSWMRGNFHISSSSVIEDLEYLTLPSQRGQSTKSWWEVFGMLFWMPPLQGQLQLRIASCSSAYASIAHNCDAVDIEF